MRWRVLLNSLERTGARDTLERLSLAVEQLGPIIAAVLLVPSLLAMSALSGFAGYALARSIRSGAFDLRNPALSDACDDRSWRSSARSCCR